jgi:hypothetical protein
MDIPAAFLCFNPTNHDSIPAANGWTDKLADKSMNEAETVLVGTNADGVDKCAVSEAEGRDVPSQEGDHHFLGIDCHMNRVLIPAAVTSLTFNSFPRKHRSILLCLGWDSRSIPLPSKAFRFCSVLKSLLFPYSVTTIGSSGFQPSNMFWSLETAG